MDTSEKCVRDVSTCIILFLLLVVVLSIVGVLFPILPRASVRNEGMLAASHLICENSLSN